MRVQGHGASDASVSSHGEPQKTGEDKTVCILVATSGDTGKAALEGFRDVEHTKILVFYPDGGVSDIQKLQMVSQEGQNVGVCAVRETSTTRRAA